MRLLSVKASAGSGKTFRLANRYIALLFRDNPINILAITFTNKAANEMREKIIKHLNILDDAMLDMISKENINKKDIINKQDELIKKFLTNDINITTIDSFINKILRKFSYLSGVKSNFDIGDIDKNTIFEIFLDSLSNNELKELAEIGKKEDKFISLIDLFEELYKKDKELLNIKIKNVKKPDETKAKEAFKRLREYILNSPVSSNKAKEQVNVDFVNIPYTTWFTKDSLKEYKYFKKKDLYKEWFEDVLYELKSYFKDYFLYKEVEFFKTLFDFYKKYKEIKWKIKKEQNLLDFKDVEHLVYDLLKGIDKEFLYFRLDSKLNHILIDEFQDTSITQWEIFEPLVDEIASGVGREEFRSFFYVGDVKQSIYRFRGGRRELFDIVAKKYKKYGLSTQELKVNYRSSKNIVEFVNKQFNLNEDCNRSDLGYVEVDLINKENVLEKIDEKIEFLKSKGVSEKNIAVLVYKNEDILSIAEFLTSKNKKVVTAKKAKVISMPSAKAIISLMRYLNNKNLKIEKLNFLSLTNQKWQEDIDFGIKIDRPILMIREIMKKYNLEDEASLKLLYHSNKYDTLKEFVEEIDNYEEELPISEFEGVVIMTIHKSKGLEFDNVIVVDRISKKKNNKSNILFYYEDAKLKDIKLKFKNREVIDKEYAFILEKEKDLEKEDDKNVEYVAYTRAKDGLIILKNEKDSAFVTNLEPQIIGEVIPSKTIKEEKITKKEIKLKNYGVQELEIKESEYKSNDYKAIYLGEAIHYMYECEDIEAVRNIYGDFCDINKVKELYENTKDLLPKGKKEIPYIKDKNVRRIDLLSEEDIITIIDYKTVKPKDERGYINQVKRYIEDIKELTNKEVVGKIFYVEDKKFRDIK